MKGLLISAIPGIIVMFIYGITNISLLMNLILLITFGCSFYGTYYYSKKTTQKGVYKFSMIAIALASYLCISLLLAGLTVISFQSLWSNYFKTEITKITSDPARYSKQELLDFRQRNSGLLSIENDTIIDDAILRVEQIETDKKIAEAKKAEEAEIERKKQEEAKKVEAEKAAKAKRIEEGYIDASGIITTTFIDPSEDSSRLQKQPFTSVKTPDGTLTIKWTFTMVGDQGDLITTVTFAPNASRSSKMKLEYLNFPEQNDEYEADHFEIISPTTIKDDTNRKIMNFSSPFK